MTITFYHFPASPPSRSVLMTLVNLELDFETKIINLMEGEHMTEEFLQINPQHTVPTIVDDGFVMAESRAINAYLVDAHKPDDATYPADPKARFIIDHRLYFDASVFSARIVDIIVPILHRGATTIAPECKDKIMDALNTMEGFLDGNEWFSGNENVSIADFSILSAFLSIYHVGLDCTDYPNIAAWHERCKELPGFDENNEGAEMFATAIKSKLTEPF